MAVKLVERGVLVFLALRRQRYGESSKFSGTLGYILKLSFVFKQELGKVGDVT